MFSLKIPGMRTRGLLILVLAHSLAAADGTVKTSPTLNGEVLASAESMARRVNGRGYDLRSAFTENLSYGGSCCVPATNSGKTMCVAAIAEVMINAINSYARKIGEKDVSTLPITSWTGHKYLNIRPHVFQYAEANSRGPGDAFERFGIGKSISFKDLLPGDFLAFSRFSGFGHASVFIGYLNTTNTLSADFSNSVIGFRYFSAQSSTNGVGYRDAYFGSIRSQKCPDFAKAKSDCGVIKENYLNGGRLLSPTEWTVNQSIERLKNEFIKRRRSLGANVDEIEIEMNRELEAKYSIDFEE